MKSLKTPAQTSEILAISTKQLHILTTAGEIAFIDIGRGGKRPTRRYQLEDIEDFINRRRTVSRPRVPDQCRKRRQPEIYRSASDILTERMAEKTKTRT